MTGVMVTKVEKIIDMAHGENPKCYYNGRPATKFLSKKKVQRLFHRWLTTTIEVGPIDRWVKIP